MLLHALIAMLACWIHRHQEQAIAYLHEENRVLKAQLKGRRLTLTDAERRRLAVLAHPIDHKCLKAIATIATAATLQRWYRRFVTPALHHTARGKKPGRPLVAPKIEALVVCMAEENASWGYRRIQGALANVGYHIDKITVRNILRRHHLDPAPQRCQRGMSWAQFVTIHWAVLSATDFCTAGRKLLAAVQTAAMPGGRNLGTACRQLASLLRESLRRGLRAWRPLWHRLGSRRLSYARLQSAELETCWRGVMPRQTVGSTEGAPVFPSPCSLSASRQRLARGAQPERDPPTLSSPVPLVMPRRQWWGNSASGSRLLSTSSMHHARSSGRRQSRHGDTCAFAVPAAA